MNELVTTESERRATPFYGKVAALIDFDAPKSSLLEETVGPRAFSTISQATRLQRNSWLEESQPMFGTGWWSMQETCAPVRRATVIPEGYERQVQAPNDKAINDRVTLLARKYVEKESLSDEEKARLAILTERVRHLVPSVTASQKESLSAAMQQIKQISESTQDIRNELGIK